MLFCLEIVGKIFSSLLPISWLTLMLLLAWWPEISSVCFVALTCAGVPVIYIVIVVTYKR